MLSSLKSHFSKYELLSFIKTFAATFITIGVAQLDAILNGDLSTTALVALAVAVLRSLIKACETIVEGQPPHLI